MTDKGALPKNLRSLTGLRFIAAGAVVVSHLLLDTGGNLSHVARHTAQFGWMGVSFFFVLSGFVLTWGARPSASAGSFWWRRFARIYPAYLVTLLAAVLIGHFVERTPLQKGPVAASVFLVQAWVPSQHWYFAGNAVAWSLSTEAFFYFTWPLLAPRIQRLTLPNLGRLAAVLSGTTVTIGIIGAVTVPSHDTLYFGGFTGRRTGWLVYICPLGRLPEFLLGVVIAAAVRQGWRPPVTWRQAWLLVLAAYVVSQILPAIMLDEVGFVFIPLALLVAATAVRDAESSGSGTLFAHRQWVLAGSASYCLYLVHELPMRIVAHHDPGPTGAVAVRFIVVCGLVALAAAWLLHEQWEVRMERVLTGRNSVDDEARAAVTS